MAFRVDPADKAAVDLILKDFKNGANRVLYRSLNKTIKSTRVQVRKRLAAYLNLTATRIEKDLKEEKATYQDLRGAVIAKGRPVGLVQFKARQLAKKGVRVKIYRKGSFDIIPHAFIATGRKGVNNKDSKNKHVFWRTYKGPRRRKDPRMRYGRLPAKYRLPLHARYGPRIEDVLAKPEHMIPITSFAASTLQKHVLSETDNILKRHKL